MYSAGTEVVDRSPDPPVNHNRSVPVECLLATAAMTAGTKVGDAGMFSRSRAAHEPVRTSNGAAADASPTDPSSTDPSRVRVGVDMVELTNPERWWLATADIMPWRTDPDAGETVPRHPDRDEIRWDVLGRVLTEVSNRLQCGEYERSARDPHVYEITFMPQGGGLTPGEVDILRSWFTTGEEPKADGWHTQLEDGRRRVWNVWRHKPNAWLPIRSFLLDYLDAVAEGGPFLAASIRERAVYGRKVLPSIVARRSPQYAAALERAQKVTTRTESSSDS